MRGLAKRLGLGLAAGAWLAAPVVADCVPLPDGIELRSFLPDRNRYLYADIKPLSGVVPAVVVIFDKNYLSPSPEADRWWLDRTRLFSFSDDKIRLRWSKTGTWTDMTSWIATPDQRAQEQTLGGLTKTMAGFAGTGTHDTNRFAFQARIEADGFDGDRFEISLPALRYDGVSLSPPVVEAVRGADTDQMTIRCPAPGAAQSGSVQAGSVQAGAAR